MKKLQFLNSLFLFTLISCSHDVLVDPVNPPLGNENPIVEEKYESKGYYLDGQFDSAQIIIRDTFYTIVGSTLGTSTYGQKPDSATLKFGIEFRAIDPAGKPIGTFNITFRKREAIAVLDSKYNYLDLNKIDEIITKGPWVFYNGKVLKDKGVSVGYVDQLNGVTTWFTESYHGQIFDYSSFRFNVDTVSNSHEDNLMVVEGSLECILYNFSNPDDQKSLSVKFKGPITYYRK
jgi:hypothetical protein